MFVEAEATQGAVTAGSAEPPPEGLPLERLEHEITELAAHINAGACRFLELVAEFDRRQGWGRSWGCRSCAEWVAWQCGFTPRTAREQVRVARSLEDYPAVHAAFARGELSYSKVRALTRMGDGYSESELMSLARDATAAQLERIARVVRRVSAAESNDAHAERYLTYHWEEDGSLSIHGRVPAEDGALVLQALDAARDAIWEHSGEETGRSDADNGSAEPPEEALENGSAEPFRSLINPQPRRVTNADALLLMADLSLAGSPPTAGRRTGGDRYQLVIHVEQSALTGELPPSTGPPRHVPSPAIEGGASIAAETARRLACDASVVTMHERDGEPLSVGRKTRTIPASIRRALGTRDKTCRYPGCELRRFLDAHHIHHWAHGGETKLDNLIHLCRHHHRLVHEGGVSVSVSSDGQVSFEAPPGRFLPPAPSPPRSHRGALAARNARARLAIGAHTNQGGTGERLDLDLAVRI